ncbi:MAG: nucleotidyltransferase domain-containing protein [Chloroflexi bacterium]|nr:nucleotidyltransferase domain-containing protein [Chloroflexota bacterium]
MYGKMLPMERNLSRLLKRRIPALKKLFAGDPRVLGVFLFGSQADGTATAHSDIDLAMLFDRDIMYDQELGFEIAVSQTLGTHAVNVTNLTRADLPIRFRAIGGEVLYESDYVRVSDFIERTLQDQRRHVDFLKRDEYWEGTLRNR